MALDIPLDRLAALHGEVALACDPAGTIAWVDEWARRLLEAQPGGSFPALMVPGGEGKAQRLVEAACAGEVHGWELTALVHARPQVLTCRGAPYPGGALIVGSLVAEDARGELEQVHTALSELATLHRESARQQREISRLYTEARQARGEAEAAVRAHNDFLATVAHDLKNPLATIKGRAQLMQRRMARDTARAAEAASLAAIEAQADAMRRLLDQLLDVARLDVGQELTLQVRPVDLQVILSRLIEQQTALGHTHAIRLEGAPPGTLVGEWDGDRIERVGANLLSNAIKYSPEDSTIVVTLAREDEPAGAWATLRVADAGVGIPADDLPHVFEQYHRGRNVAGRVPGMGIGLAGTRRIVERHGGTIAVQSTENVGTTFTVRLPLADDAVPE